jgi:type I restriction-modification system DNA methylase subunit
LRAASATGAAVGNVTNKEGDRFENLKASLERSQSFDDLKASLARLQSQARATRDTIKQTFDDTYAYKNQGGSGNAPAGAVDTDNPLLRGKK